MRKRFWITFTICLIVFGPLLGAGGLLVGFGRALSQSSSRDEGWVELLYSFPIPIDVPVINGVFWAILISWLAGAAVTVIFPSQKR